MREITITILKEDILLDNYMNSDECPITRALHRAGYEGLKDIGDIVGVLDGEEIEITNQNSTYDSLIDKLFGMYNSIKDNDFKRAGRTVKAIPVEDFTHTIIIN